MEANASGSIAVMFSFSVDSSEACEVACIVYTVMTTAVPMAPDNWRMDLPAEYVDIDIKTASLVGIIIWWLRKGLHFSSDYIADQIYLMYRVQ